MVGGGILMGYHMPLVDFEICQWHMSLWFIFPHVTRQLKKSQCRMSLCLFTQCRVLLAPCRCVENKSRPCCPVYFKPVAHVATFLRDSEQFCLICKF